MQLVSLCLRPTFHFTVTALLFLLCFSCAKSPIGSTLEINVPLSTSQPIDYRAAVWNQVSDSEAWTETALREIRTHRSEFEMARDKSDFCPGYETANERNRDICWLRLVSAVVKFESGFNPRDRFREASGIWSVGLLALSAHECANAPTSESLTNPHKNLVCGIAMMANLIAKDGFIDGPATSRGAASYWSTLRAPYVSRHLHVGKKRGVMNYTRQYLDY